MKLYSDEAHGDIGTEVKRCIAAKVERVMAGEARRRREEIHGEAAVTGRLRQRWRYAGEERREEGDDIRRELRE